MALTISQAVALMNADLKKVQDESLMVITDEVLDETPVHTGALKASMTPSKGEPKPDNINPGDGDTRRHDYEGVVKSIEPGETYSLSNAQPHGPKIEFENYSPKGDHMMTKAIARWDTIVEDATKKVRNS